MKNRTQKGSLENHGMAVRALCFTQSSKHLISAAEDLHVFVSDVETLQRKQTIVGHSKYITDVAAHPQNEDQFITASLDHTIKLWSIEAPSKPIKSINMGSPVWSAKFSSTGDFIFAITEHGTISLVNCRQADDPAGTD